VQQVRGRVVAHDVAAALAVNLGNDGIANAQVPLATVPR
jgi:hypothetical protein